MMRRFAFIEARLLWGGGVTARELGEAFGIARQNAQHTIDAYRRRHPGQMEYDRRCRRHVRSPVFEVGYIRAEPNRFLDYQRGVSQIARFHDEADWADLPFADADTLVHPVYDGPGIRVLLAALRREAAVEIEYWSMRGSRVRLISPHHLVFADGRYHVRGFCHFEHKPRDFVLSRVVAASPSREPWISGDEDRDWQGRSDLRFRINPELPESAQAAVRLDFIQDTGDELVVRGVRRALVLYVQRRLCRPHWRFGIPLWVAVDD